MADDDRQQRQQERDLVARLTRGVRRRRQATVEALAALWMTRPRGCFRRLPPAIGASPEAVGAVAGCLSDPDPNVRTAAAAALGCAGKARSEAVAALATALTDAHVPVRLCAARALVGEVGQAAPALRAALADPVRGVRWEAALALAQHEQSPGVRAVLLDYFRVQEREYRAPEPALAQYDLKRAGLLAPERVPALFAEVEQAGPGAEDAAELLGLIEGERARPELVALLAARLAETGAEGYANALGRAGARAELEALLGSPSATVRRAALWGLRRAGPPEGTRAPALLADPDGPTRAEAAALCAERELTTLAELERWMAAQSGEVQRGLVRELRWERGHSKALLRTLLDGPDLDLRGKALTAIWNLRSP